MELTGEIFPLNYNRSGTLTPIISRLGICARSIFSATDLHNNELQANVSPNYPQVTLFGKGISSSLSINNANLKENSGIFGRIFFKTAK